MMYSGKRKMGLIIAVLMLMASVGAVIARPSGEVAVPAEPIGLAAAIPTSFGDWTEVPQHRVKLVDPQLQTFIDSLYSEILERVYVNSQGYTVMLSVAYGPDQRGSLMAHSPERCYVGQGFEVSRSVAEQLATPFGVIPVARFFANKGSRMEPVTYWRLIGDNAVRGWQQRLVELGYVVTGRVPDGLLFRVSSIDKDQVGATQIHGQFVNQLLQAVGTLERKRLSGLGEPVSQ